VLPDGNHHKLATAKRRQPGPLKRLSENPVERRSSMYRDSANLRRVCCSGLKMMTKPGEQFVIRRRAYAMIKKAFDANGIEIAFPTVTVAGGGEPSAAVAQKGLELVQPPAPAT
jgi:hypothetical protein